MLFNKYYWFSFLWAPKKTDLTAPFKSDVVV